MVRNEYLFVITNHLIIDDYDEPSPQTRSGLTSTIAIPRGPFIFHYNSSHHLI
jgi:hypothetical protein